jgi:heat shock protein 90kDa beta
MRREFKAIFILCLLFVQNVKVINAQGSDDGDSSTEKHEFQAEVGRLMDIIINSLYTQKEIFLREIISNASDALDKLRFLSVSNPNILGDQTELEIRIEYDADAKTLSVADTGIGMNKQELIQNLGTVAKSGTTNFIEAIKGGNLNLIGQFGVGFYSTFLAGTKVTVNSKKTDEEANIWESSAAHSFTIRPDSKGEIKKRGTKVTIHLKQDAYEFAEEDRIKNLVKKYSEFINFPIYLRIAKEVSKEVAVEEEEKKEEKKEDEEKKDDDVEVKDEEKKETKPKTKTVKEKVYEWVLVNDNKALWLRNKDDIEEQEYHKFYRALTKDSDGPASYIHFNAEGEVEFKSILYIPQKAPYDLFENYYGRSSSLKLYVRRVLINEEFEDLMPRYLNFIRGVVDSDELPLNVSRESLQQLKMMKVISRKLVRKAIEMMKKLAESKEDDDDEEEGEEEEEAEKKEGEAEKKDDENKDEKTDEEKKQDKERRKQEQINRYLKFWREFGKNLKLGIIEDPANRSKLAKLSRWYSSKNITELISLDEYIARAKQGQDHIYFIAGEDKETSMKAPVLQGLLKRGYEVLILDDPIDEFCFQHLNEYERKKLTNVQKGEFRFPDDDDTGRKKFKKLRKIYQPLTDWWKRIQNDILENVQVSQRLVSDPVIIVSSEHGQSASMERISKAQAYAHTDRQNLASESKKILEINPSHPVIKELLERVKDNADVETEEYAKLLTDTALINSGYSIRKPHEFATRFYKVFNGAIGIAKDAQIQDVEVSLDDDDEEEKKKPEPTPEKKDDEDKDDEEDEGRKTKDDL